MKKHLFRAVLLTMIVVLIATMSTPAFGAKKKKKKLKCKPPAVKVLVKKGKKRTKKCIITPPPPLSFVPQPTGDTYDAGGSPIDVVNADFNNDGALDLATANLFNPGPRDISVRFGNGDGTFQAEAKYYDAGGPAASPTSLAARDLNADGFPDIVMTTQEGQLAIFLNAGAGSPGNFTSPASQVIATGGLLSFDVATGDYDGDNDPDLAVTNVFDAVGNTPGNIAILTNNGAGVFAAGQLIASDGNPTGIARADFNHDNLSDLAVSDALNNEIDVYLNTGVAATPFPAAPDTQVTVGTNPLGIIADDFNDDGAPDLATANNVANNVSVALGNGTGGFSTAQNFTTGSEGPYDLAGGDYNQDGNLDIAVVNQFTATGGGAGNNKGNVAILLGSGTTFFSAPLLFDVGDGPDAVARGDYNGDSKPDLVVANFGAGDPLSLDTISVLRNATDKPAVGSGGVDSESVSAADLQPNEE